MISNIDTNRCICTWMLLLTEFSNTSKLLLCCHFPLCTVER